MLKQALLFAGALSLTTSAFALEVTNPFYVPTKGSVASTTSYDFSTTTVKQPDVDVRARSYNHNASEKLSYGLTDTIALDATIGNTWDKTKVTEDEISETTSDNKNVAWEIGGTWNALTGATKLQVNAAYGQTENHGIAGSEDDGAYKYVTAGAKLGHTIGIYTPYLAGTVESPVFQSHDADHHTKYTGKAGVYAYCPRAHVAFDTGLTAGYDSNHHAKTLNYDLEVSYLFTDNVALSAYGSYMINGRLKDYYDDPETKQKFDMFGKSAGLRLRAAF